MMSKAEIMEELEELGDSLAQLMQMEGAIYVVDLTFFAQRVADLKQDLRVAETRERNR